MTKNIILCADDYAQSPSISQGIVNLIAQKRLSATSCLVTSEYWLEHADWLKPYAEQIDIGLHFNLTMGAHFSTLSTLILKTYLAQIPQNEIETELDHQLDQFEKALGKLPDFIDGHQHIQCLPKIRQALINCYNKRLRAHKVWVRNISPSHVKQLFSAPASIKKIILYLIGGRTFKQLLMQAQIPHNNSFAGVYNFSITPPYTELFPQFLTTISDNDVIMCHPGLADEDMHDPIANTRVLEYQYFSSNAFLAACAQHQITLSRFHYSAGSA